MSRFVIRIFFILVALVMLRGAYTEMRTWLSFERDSDFPVYYTAACLVRGHRDLHIYDPARMDANPAYGNADPDTVFYRTAQSHGIRHVRRYIYPPTLADLMVPLTVLSPFAALIVWDLLNLAAFVLAGIMFARLLGIHEIGQSCLVVVSALLFRPTLDCFYYGQAPIILLFLLIAGLSLHAHGKKDWAGLMFALAIAIKLTPLIVIVPFIAWRDWKTLRAIGVWCVAILGSLLLVNGSDVLVRYVVHVLPAMLHKELDMTNITLGTAVQVFWYGSDKGTPLNSLVWVGRFLSIFAIGYAGWLSAPGRGEKLPQEHRLTMFAVFLLISCCIAPVSWRHAYVLSAPALVILAKQIWERRSNAFEMLLALFFLMELSSVKAIALAKTTHLAIYYYLAVVTPVLGLLLALVVLHRLRSNRYMQAALPLENAEV